MLDWLPDWQGETVVIVGSGPSATSAPLKLARRMAKFVAVNSSWALIPWGDMLYAHSVYWWREHKGVPDFKGIKVAIDREAQDDYPEINLVKCPFDPKRSYERKLGDRFHMEMLFDEIGVIGWGKNGGYQATNLVAQLKPRRIVLVGIEATTRNGTHWHGDHPHLKNPTEADTKLWRKYFDQAAPALAKRGIEVLNAAPFSALTAYRKVNFCDIFGLS